MEPDKNTWWNSFYYKGKIPWGHLPSTFLQRMVYQFPTNAKILDLGCGHGRNISYLYNLGFQVTGIDFSDVAINDAKQLCDATFITKNLVEETNWIDDTFDVVIDFGFYHFFPSERRYVYVQELLKVLNPGGIYINESGRLRDHQIGGPLYKPPQFQLQDFQDIKDHLQLIQINEAILPPHGTWGEYPCWQIVCKK
ncbi:MAG: class I SAM-dependent methyltransferase [Muricauda sp. TMED12]|nr:MAG: class I SAM-dependent methyltransferase [Muricauda sp. TMED12]